MRFLQSLLKIVISLGLLAFLVYRARPERVLAVLTKVQAQQGLPFLFGALFLMILAVLFLALRWKVLLKGYGFRLTLSELFGFYLIGMFFNNFLPSSIGGDVMRIYKVINATNDRTSGFASVIIERIMGIAATLFMAIIALVYVSRQFHDTRLLTASVGLFVFIGLFFASLMRERSFQLILKLFDKFTIFKIGQKFNKLFEAIHYFKEKRRILFYVFALSLISQILIVLMNYMLALAFDISVSFGYLLMVVPVTFVITMLPSINGIGIRDLGYVGLLAQIGISTAEALSLSFMNVIIPMLISLAGGILFVLQKDKFKLGGQNALDTNP